MSYAHHGCVLGAQSQVSFCRRVSDPFTLAYLPLFPPVTTELLCVSVSLSVLFICCFQFCVPRMSEILRVSALLSYNSHTRICTHTSGAFGGWL